MYIFGLFRASSVGRYDDREGLNPEVVPRFGSARSSPAPPLSRTTLSKFLQKYFIQLVLKVIIQYFRKFVLKKGLSIYDVKQIWIIFDPPYPHRHTSYY